MSLLELLVSTRWDALCIQVATFINDADYSDKQKRAVAIAIGTSLNMLEKDYIDTQKRNI